MPESIGNRLALPHRPSEESTMHQVNVVNASPQIAMVGSYVPRQCGIATFSQDLRGAILRSFSKMGCKMIAVTDQAGAYDYPAEVDLEIEQQNAQMYIDAAEYLNSSLVDAVLLQHEFGLYGGPAGSYLTSFLRQLRKPLIAILHTVLSTPDDDQRRVMAELITQSARLVVMADKGREMLEQIYAAPADRIAVVPHGIPDLALSDSERAKHALGFGGRSVAMTFGLLSPGKGIETMIAALPQLVRTNPNFLYAVVGATHPHLRASEGERYRDSLRKLADELGVASHLRFVDRYVDLPDLLQLLAASDIYVTPYLNEAQICSGTLAYAVGLGKPVVSTPYWHAQELLADDRGLLVPFSDPRAMAGAVGRLLSDRGLRSQTEALAFALGRTMTWSAVAQRYAMIIGDVTNRPIPLQQADSHFEAQPQTSFSQAGSSDPLRADAPRLVVNGRM
ncbi:glycosyltransferase family 4 protein [Croceicoccus marinus]|uniref:Glycosyltransferase n=1 Tax=Croceicoccus marinus TaxID=450378 RepID=A0A7G6VYU1_9SPHN|nr:glycosyltransferase family 4 protein [Croceicoccus marinus]QNE06906.1 glycosyltransferase [Croceicoccus marinus]